jgi:hypothetical protein
MTEVDDRLVGDPVWELFPIKTPDTDQAARGVRRFRRWLARFGLVAAAWLLSPAAGVVAACVLVAAADFRSGWQLRRSLPDKAGGTICARFAFAWGTWKAGVVAFALMFAVILAFAIIGGRREVPPAFVAALLLGMYGFAASAAWTAAGLLAAYRSGMRVWIGEGVNQARTLMLGMLITAFTVGVLGPLTAWLAVGLPPVVDRQSTAPVWFGLGFFGCMFGGPVVILIVLDWFSRRIVAERPGKFGPKVPTVGKWNT